MKFLVFCFFTLFLLFYNCYNVLCQQNTTSTTTVRNAISDSHKAKEPEISINITMGTPISIRRPSAKPKKSAKFICPGKNDSRPFFSLPCKTTKECTQLGKNMRCCNNRCLKGVPAPPPEPVHSPTLFGLVERACPTELIPEIFEIKRCIEDSDCSPRICCPEKMLNGDMVGYCRTPEAKLDNIPGVRQLVEPFRLMMNYMQCTPPPPPILDVFPKECRYPLDCFPNLCCQERGKRYCRPPKRSLLTLLTTVAQRIVPTETAREIINRIAP